MLIRFEEEDSKCKKGDAVSGIATKHGIENSEAAIFARLWDSDENMLSPELAGHVMKLSFSEQDKARMHELAAKCCGSICRQYSQAGFAIRPWLPVVDLFGPRRFPAGAARPARS